MRSAFTTIVGIACVIFILYALFADFRPTSPCVANYDALREGMTHEEANRAAGCKSVELSRTDVSGDTIVHYGWVGPSNKSIMGTFTNGRLVAKSLL